MIKRVRVLTNPLTIFIVDDQDDVRAALHMLLKLEGFKVLEFNSARAFLTAYQADWQGCLLLDLGLPDMNGLLVQQQLKRLCSQLSLIMMSGHGDATAAARALAAGALAFLTKPIDIHVLRQHLALASQAV